MEIKNNALILLEDVDVVFNDQGYYHEYKLNFYSRESLSARVPLVTIHIIACSEPARKHILCPDDVFWLSNFSAVFSVQLQP